jgi:hypothetical protein
MLALNELAVELANKCSQSHCDYKVIWVPRCLNVEADQASRLEDPDNWGILPGIFQCCQQRWGRFSVDRFADSENTQCSRFNSRFFVAQAEAVDCFGENWQADLNWVVPPFSRSGEHYFLC